jgi:hypothetical protein
MFGYFVLLKPMGCSAPGLVQLEVVCLGGVVVVEPPVSSGLRQGQGSDWQ